MNIRLEDRFDELLNQLEAGAQNAATATAEAIADEARANAPVQSGALKAGIYAAPAGDSSAYQAAADAVHRANPQTQVSSVGSSDLSSEGVHAATAESIVDYSAIIHNGYGSRAGRPFLENAFNSNEGTFDTNLKNIANELREF